MLRVSYFKHSSGNYFVTLVLVQQTIVCGAKFFERVAGIQSNTLAGCGDYDMEKLFEMGFEIPSSWLRKTV